MLMSNREEVVAEALADAVAEIPGFGASEATESVYGGWFFEAVFRSKKFEIMVKEQK